MKPYFETPSVTLYNSDCLTALNALPDGSIQTCVTSPPYYGLRDYKTATWEGGAEDCDHVEKSAAELRDRNPKSTLIGAGYESNYKAGERQYRHKCAKCGAVRVDKQIGLEETPQEYVAKLTEIFREVRRVLRDDGTLWLNIGDSYANSAVAGDKVFGNPEFNQNRPSRSATQTAAKSVPQGLKPNDLIGIPWRVAFALQADGWWLRQDIIWAKPNPMPESVTDRCTKAHEYIFLLSKSARYFYDSGAVKEPSLRPGGSGHFGGEKGRNHETKETDPNYRNGHEQWGRFHVNDVNRNRRSVWSVATKPYSGAHFAVFPPELITPCILAGAPLGGTVLDPFAGSGTTLQTAKDLGRKAVGIELNPDYCPLIVERCQQLTIFDSELAHV